jgi:hypothetical protein
LCGGGGGGGGGASGEQAGAGGRGGNAVMLTVSPLNISFDSQTIGTTEIRKIQVKNQNSFNVPTIPLTAIIWNPALAVSLSTCTQGVNANGGICEMEISFTPTHIVESRGLLRVCSTVVGIYGIGK